MMRISGPFPPVDSGLEEKPVDAKTMAEYLGVSEYTVRAYAQRGEIPSFRLSTGPRAPLRFYLSEVRAHLTRPVDPFAAPRSRRRHSN
ncbi:helix-turn-helix domain-containing protein [Agromyces aureus]